MIALFGRLRRDIWWPDAGCGLGFLIQPNPGLQQGRLRKNSENFYAPNG
jgi:hypothetical protein